VRGAAHSGSGGAAYDGASPAALARRLGVPRLVVLDETTSTLDLAHAVAEQGAPDGTLVLADRQSAGRGRLGRAWASQGGAGIWLTLVARAVAPDALPVLSIRLGLAAAPALDAFAGETVRLKWPNDLHLAGGKLAGILVEARWQASQLAWAAVGFGLNVRAPAGVPGAAGLLPGVARGDVLAALVPALRTAIAARGPLAPAELDAFAARDLARGRRCAEPVPGVVAGLGADGALLVHDGAALHRAYGGSLTFAAEPAPSRGTHP
jgi:BirA family biotin operon repressor/biotin-[acetyl-CoA-carboxylase] ligase